MIATSVIEIAEPKGQLRDCRNKSTIALPMKKTFPPPRKAGIRNSPISRIKTSMQPVAIPGIESGRVICQNVLNGLPPRSLDASSRLLSSLSSETKMGKTINGR